MTPATRLRALAEDADREARRMRREMPSARPEDEGAAVQWDRAEKLAKDREARAQLLGRCAESAEACGAIEVP